MPGVRLFWWKPQVNAASQARLTRTGADMTYPLSVLVLCTYNRRSHEEKSTQFRIGKMGRH